MPFIYKTFSSPCSSIKQIVRFFLNNTTIYYSNEQYW
jgi:hypothetical protein